MISLRILKPENLETRIILLVCLPLLFFSCVILYTSYILVSLELVWFQHSSFKHDAITVLNLVKYSILWKESKSITWTTTSSSGLGNAIVQEAYRWLRRTRARWHEQDSRVYIRWCARFKTAFSYSFNKGSHKTRSAACSHFMPSVNLQLVQMLKGFLLNPSLFFPPPPRFEEDSFEEVSDAELMWSGLWICVGLGLVRFGFVLRLYLCLFSFFFLQTTWYLQTLL